MVAQKNGSTQNLYELLEVSPRASQEVIHAAYKALMKKHHPDIATDPHSTRVARQLNEAKEILLDSQKRARYDEENNMTEEGTVLGNWRLVEKIAEGGFGVTYKGEHTILGEPVCVKRAHYVSALDEEILRNEAKAIWDLRHPGLPAVRDLLRLEDNSLALVMSYIPGPTLEKIIEKHERLDSEHVAWIAERCLSALWYLHLHGVVHGDVKPQNVIIQPETHEIVLVDYGLSAVQPNHKTRSIGHTPYFAPPEQVAGGPLLPESDFYGLGMTMIYALGGDVGKKRVPSSTPDALTEFIADFIVHDVRSRPTWETENLVQRLSDIREKAFGRRRSNMAPLPTV